MFGLVGVEGDTVGGAGVSGEVMRAVVEVAHSALCSSYKICGFCREKMEALGGLWNREMARPDSSLF